MTIRAVLGACACLLPALGPASPAARALSSAAATPSTYEPIDATFPLTVEAGRFLADAAGTPFLVQGDSAWSLIVQLDLADADEYLVTRRSQGFNTVLVNLIESRFADDPPRNAAGEEPFLTPGDFTTPNDAYFDHAHAVVARAAELGFAVFLAPAYLGYDGGDEGWYQAMQANGPATLREYGRYVGARFADLGNIVWVAGGDYLPPDEHLGLVTAVTEGIAETAPGHLHTAHWDPGRSAADVAVDFLDVDTTYTNDSVHIKSLSDHDRGGPPRVLIESAYEHDRLEVTDQRIRAQAYGALLTGAVGQFYGHGSVWQFAPDWRDALRTPAAAAMTHLRVLFDSLPWTELQPDTDGTVLIDGAGEFTSDDYAVAAATPFLAVIYVPGERTLTLATLELGPQPLAGASAAAPTPGWWYDPTSGVTRTLGQWTVDASGSISVATPGANDAGDDDWVLVLPTSSAPEP